MHNTLPEARPAIWARKIGCGSAGNHKTEAAIILPFRVTTTRSKIVAILGATLLTGCAGHSFPLSNRFIIPDAASDTAEVFSDTNGTLYPSGWQSYFHPKFDKKRPGEGRWRAGNLLAQSEQSPKFRSLIERDEVRQLNELRAFSNHHKRIFILVHGYNTSVAETTIPYSMIEAELDLKPGDGIIRFYWDGLIGKGAGALKIWFKVANDSQLVGSRGLRAVLSQISGREVYIIAHSRGASVVMSALGNPVYESGFFARLNRAARNWGRSYHSILAPKPLDDQSNNIHVLMLAPAIDRIDFCDSSQQPRRSKDFVCTKLRPLGGQVKSFDYTVNTDDPVLGKFIFSSHAFNPTGLGYSPNIGRGLKGESYPILREYLLEKPQSFHGFKEYAAHPVFLEMLHNIGIGKVAAQRPMEPLAN
ncbi:alpha/beta hydrolase [Aquisediminimonas profunda]|uniref:alpha/beta hydrolase n=1 Tax=Aquisediminimonas profunda TaxID=1550733 RepID=UPI001C62FCF7|nr:alpha/beta hydrolase [Aquisediminimonas profunda]